MGRVDCVLTGHGVDDQECVVGADCVADLADLPHQFFVDRKTPRRIDEDDVSAGALGFLDRLAGDIDRVGRLGEDRHADLAAKGAELFDRSRTLKVGTDEQRIATLPFKPLRELGGVGGLTSTLQAGHEHDRGRLGGISDLHRLATEARRELLKNDLDDLLGRVERLAQLFANGSLANTTDHVLGDVEVDVGLEKRQPDLAQDVIDIVLIELSTAADAAEDPVEPVRECLEHGPLRLSARPGLSGSLWLASAT